METAQTPDQARRRGNQAKRSSSPRSLGWNGVRMRTVAAGADPDAPPRLVTLPVDWDDLAASALAELAPGDGAVTLAQCANFWIGTLADDPRAAPGIGDRLSRLLLHRAACPSQAVWHMARHAAPVFVVNLAAFAQPGGLFDLDGFIAAIGTVTEACVLAGPSGRSSRILLGNLDCCLAHLGLDYDSDEARDVAACLAALATATAHPDTVPGHAAFAALPSRTVIPTLAAKARSAWQQAVSYALDNAPELFPRGGQVETGFSTPGPVDALLGIEACGIATIFSPVRADGKLAASTMARLAARRLSPEAALAATLLGETVLKMPDSGAMAAMHRAVAPFVDRIPALVAPAAAPRVQSSGPTPLRRELPARHGGFTQKAVVGGHKLYVRTGEYVDGSLGEISINPVRDNAAQRGLMEAFSQAVSIGLQHGVPFDAFVEAFAYTRFGPQGAVEGDETVSSATSLLDYTFRTLAHAYLDRTLPDAAPDELATAGDSDETLLPLDLPQPGQRGARPQIRPKPGVRQRHGLKLVG